MVSASRGRNVPRICERAQRMTKSQIALLRALIAADRDYWKKRVNGELAHGDERGIEIWHEYNGVHMNTATSLVDAGLAEIVNIRASQNFVFLVSYNPENDIDLDELEARPATEVVCEGCDGKGGNCAGCKGSGTFKRRSQKL